MLLRSTLQFFLFLFYISSINGFSSSNPSAKESSAIHFEMIHRHAPRLLGDRTLTHYDRIQELLHADKIRMQILSHKRNLRHASSSRRIASQLPASFSTPLINGEFTDTASYYVSFKVGTPAQEFLLLLDTGSDLTWMNCRFKCSPNQGNNQPDKGTHCSNPSEYNLTRKAFQPERSQTFKTIPCQGRFCQEALLSLNSDPDRCVTPNSPCSYDYAYISTEVAQGVFAKETVTVKLSNCEEKKIPDILIGCTREWNESYGIGKGDGIFGMGFNPNGFVNNVYKNFEGKFSYCLMDQYSTNITNYLTFGHRQVMPPNMQTTLLGVIGDHFGVTVEGIFVNGMKLNISNQVWNIDQGRGMMVDSGFSLTSWVPEAYDPIITALEKPLEGKLKKVQVPGFDSCFEVPNSDSYKALVPKFEIQFSGGARLAPQVDSYFIIADAGVRCFGFQMAPEDSPGKSYSILGNVMQQNHMWEFDILGEKLGFAPSTCELSAH